MECAIGHISSWNGIPHPFLHAAFAVFFSTLLGPHLRCQSSVLHPIGFLEEPHLSHVPKWRTVSVHALDKGLGMWGPADP